MYMSCWWTWWFGGGFGGRIYIDMYGIMALAACSTYHPSVLATKKETGQYGMTACTYWADVFPVTSDKALCRDSHPLGFNVQESLLAIISCGSGIGWIICTCSPFTMRNYAGRGSMYFYDMREDRSVSEGTCPKIAGIKLMIREIEKSKTLPGDIRRYARRMDIPVEEATRMTAQRMFLMKRDHQFY